MTDTDVAALTEALETVADHPANVGTYDEHAEAILAALAASKVKLATVESIYDALEATQIGYNTDQRKLWAVSIWEWLNAG